MTNTTKKFNILGVFKIIILSILVLLIGINFVSKKEDLAIDETYTYGLANSSFQANIEDFKEYTGTELLSNYATVNPNKRFDIENVVFNQTMDTHPPLYYLIVNFICSINAGKFSLWYGLIINVIFLIAVFWEMRYLMNLIIEDKLSSTILTLLSFFSYGFTNEIVFTRMYVMLTACSLAFVILILNKLKNNESNDFSFLIKFFIICIIGMLTQYHFAIIAFIYSVIFAIEMFKNKKYKLLILTALIGVFSLLICVLIFPAMINHVFGNETLHSLVRDGQNTLKDNFYAMFMTMRIGIFGNGFYIYIGILIVLTLINIIISIKKKSNLMKGALNKYYFYFLFTSLIYYVIISSTTKYTFERYLYNIYPFIYIVILSPIYLLLKKIKNPFKYVTIIVLIVLCVMSLLKKAPSNLCTGDSLFEEYLYNIKDTKTILLYSSVDEDGIENSMATSKWKLPYPFYLFRHMKNMTFVDIGYVEKLHKSTDKSISGYNDIVLVIYTTQNDNELIGALMEKNNVTNVQKLFFTHNIHVYRLTQ